MTLPAGKDHIAFPSEQDSLSMLKNHGETNVMILEALHSREHKKLVPYFQPIVSVADGSVLADRPLARPIGLMAAQGRARIFRRVRGNYMRMNVDDPACHVASFLRSDGGCRVYSASGSTNSSSARCWPDYGRRGANGGSW